MRRALPLSASILATITALGLAACSSQPKQPAQAPETTSGSLPAAPSSGAVASAGGIFAVANAIHEAEVEQAKLAMKKASDPRVKAFATELANDHTAQQQRLDQVMKSLKTKPQDNAVSERIKADEKQRVSQLKALSDADFDRSYIDEQIDYYRMALDTFDRELIPSASDPMLRANLEEARARAKRHLEEAQDLRAALGTVQAPG